MAYSLVAHVGAKSTTGSGFTSGSINTSGADLLIVMVGNYSGTQPTLSDSVGGNSNTWVPLTRQDSGNSSSALIYYAKNATVGSGHTFTLTGNNSFASMEVQAWSGSDLTAPFDVQNGANESSNATTLQPGSVTPSNNGSLIVAGLCLRGFGTPGDTATVNSGFTDLDQQTGVSSQCLGSALAYLVQGTAGAVNPTWTWTHGDDAGAVIAVFKAAAGGATVLSPWWFYGSQGIGGGGAF